MLTELYNDYAKALSLYNRALFVSNLAEEDASVKHKEAIHGINNAIEAVSRTRRVIAGESDMASNQENIKLSNFIAQQAIHEAEVLKNIADNFTRLLKGDSIPRRCSDYYEYWTPKEKLAQSPFYPSYGQITEICTIITSIYVDAQLHIILRYGHLFEVYSILLKKLSTNRLFLWPIRVGPSLSSYQSSETISFWRENISQAFKKTLKLAAGSIDSQRNEISITKECRAYWDRLENISSLYLDDIERLNDRIDNIKGILDNRFNLHCAIYGIIISTLLTLATLLIMCKQEWLDRGDENLQKNVDIAELQKVNIELDKIAGRIEALNRTDTSSVSAAKQDELPTSTVASPQHPKPSKTNP